MTKKYEFVTGDTKVVNGVTLKRIQSLVVISATDNTPEINIGDIGGYIEHEGNLDNSIISMAWVYGDACVQGNARVYDDAHVYGKALVCGDACVYDRARVYGNACLYDNAWVYDNARVYGDAHVYENARVYGAAHVYESAWVHGNARVYGDAHVYENACVYSSARVHGDADVYGDAGVSGDAWVCGDACVYNDKALFVASKVGTENGTLTVFNTKSNTLLVTRGCFTGTPEEFLEASREKHDSDTHEEYQLLVKVATSRITRWARQRNDEIA